MPSERVKAQEEDLLRQMEEVEAREKAVAVEANRLAALENKLEVATAKIEAAASGATGESMKEVELYSPVLSDKSKGKTYRVIARNEGLRFRSAIVHDCCDGSEAVRVVLHHFNYKETHHIRCAVEQVN